MISCRHFYSHDRLIDQIDLRFRPVNIGLPSIMVVLRKIDKRFLITADSRRNAVHFKIHVFNFRNPQPSVIRIRIVCHIRYIQQIIIVEM